MLTSAGYPPTSVANLNLNTLADGLFHAATYLFTLIGLTVLWRSSTRSGVTLHGQHRRRARHPAHLDFRVAGQETAVLISSTTFLSTAGLQVVTAYDVGQMSPSSRLAASWKPRVA